MSAVDPRLWTILVCPVCKGKLTLIESPNRLFCDSCRRPYLINADGVPIMTVRDD